MGVDQKPETKANSDYKKRTKNPDTETKNTTFVFITPRKWEGKTRWLKAKRSEKKWLDVLVWDCDDLEQWLETAPAVDAWLARLLGKFPTGVRDLSSYWLSLAATSIPPLTPAVFLAGRSKAEKALREALASVPAEIAISALSLWPIICRFSRKLLRTNSCPRWSRTFSARPRPSLLCLKKMLTAFSLQAHTQV
jgi:hypothetical protein